MAEQRLNHIHESLPHPDPTEMTSRATEAAKEQLRREIECVKELFMVRLEQMDKATMLLQTWRETLPHRLQEAVAHSSQVFEERFETQTEKFASIQVQFGGVQRQFAERETRTEQMKLANDAALKAALDAAKEAFTQQNIAFTRETQKSENLLIKQIDTLVESFRAGNSAMDEKIDTVTKTLDDKIAGVEKQLTLMVGTGVGQATNRATQQVGSTHLLGIIGAVVAVAMFLFVVLRDGGAIVK